MPLAPGAPVVAACLKLVHRRVAVDPITGTAEPDPRSAGMSPADEAALEWALRVAASTGGSVLAATAGPEPADAVLREALAAGADRAVRVDASPSFPSDWIALALAGVLRGASVVFCGDASLDRGTSAMPAFLAAELGAAQALGLVGVHLEAPSGDAPLVVRAERRLDRGRREHLRLAPPCVLSVEAATARLRRAPLGAVLAARGAMIDVVAVPPDSVLGSHRGAEPAPSAVTGSVSQPAITVRTGPFRPRARVVPAPASSLGARERVLALTGMLKERAPARTFHLGPEEAADVLVATLEEWGELA